MPPAGFFDVELQPGTRVVVLVVIHQRVPRLVDNAA
jgi:hypothetical protein